MIDRYLTNYIKPKIDDTSEFAKRFNKDSFDPGNMNNSLSVLQQYIEFHPEISAAYAASECVQTQMTDQTANPAHERAPRHFQLPCYQNPENCILARFP